MIRNQSGFTLMEIAIVLVIIGLLLGGVLKGQELINNAKVKNLTTDFKNVPVFIYGYQDKYKALPGDDINVQLHLGTSVTPCTPAGTATCNPGDGIIEGNWNDQTIASESYVFWQHIRLAGFAPGDINTSDSPSTYLSANAFGGRIGVTNSLAANSPIATPTPLQGTFIVCSDSIPFKFAKQLDTTLDDGNTQTGSVMVTAHGTTSGGAAIPTTGSTTTDDTPVMVCMGY